MKTSKSRTFERQTDLDEVMFWIQNQIDDDVREVIESGASPSCDYISETKFKYIITITKITDEKENARR